MVKTESSLIEDASGKMLHTSERLPLCFQTNRVIYSIQNFAHYRCLTCAESHKAAPCLAVWDCSMWLKADTGFLECLPAVKDVWPSHIYKQCVCLWWPEMPGTPVSNSRLSAVRSFSCYGHSSFINALVPPFSVSKQAQNRLSGWLQSIMLSKSAQAH